VEKAVYRIDSKCAALAEEFRQAPFGPHSAELEKLLQLLRWGPLAGRPVLVCTRPYREWVIGVLPGRRGEPIALETDRPFGDLEAAMWALFQRRWERHTGEPLQLAARPGGPDARR
jgi:hypothetical protein